MATNDDLFNDNAGSQCVNSNQHARVLSNIWYLQSQSSQYSAILRPGSRHANSLSLLRGDYSGLLGLLRARRDHDGNLAFLVPR